MKNKASGLMKSAVPCLAMALLLVAGSGFVRAQVSVQGVLQDAARDAAKDAAKDAVKSATKDVLGVKKVEGQSEMMDGAGKMMRGRQMLKEDLTGRGKLKKGAALEGEKSMTQGHSVMSDGDKLIQAGKTAQGKKKLLDGSKMMMDAKGKMLDDLTRKGLASRTSPSEGETLMDEGESMMRSGEMKVLK